MKEVKHVIKDELGIHARPAGMLIKVASQYACSILIKKDGQEADAKRILGVMGLGAKKGDTIRLVCDGPGEEEAIKVLEGFLRENL